MPVGTDAVGMAELYDGLYREFGQDVPRATFAVQPATDLIVNVPAVVYATGQAVPSPTYTVRGIRVRLTLTPQYVWDFGDGTLLDSGSEPGRPYAGSFEETVEHAYAKAGPAAIALTATWRATFTAFGETFTVPRAVVRRDVPRAVRVREARAQLQDG